MATRKANAPARRPARRQRSAKELPPIPRAVVLLSGGVDSVTLLHYVSKRLGIPEIHALSFLYGQKHAREIEMAAWQAKSLGIAEHHRIDLSFYGALIRSGSALTDPAVALPDLASVSKAQRRQPPTYVPNRNLILLALAAGYAETVHARHVFYGAQAQDEYGYWDCTPQFVRRVNSVLALNRVRPVRIYAPFAGQRKADVLRIGLELGVDYAHTWSCYRGGDRPCGTCPSCSEREAAFRKLGTRNAELGVEKWPQKTQNTQREARK
jgi:7-cyano-7-deazaguanine synthase